MSKCGICGCELDQPDKPGSVDCGGDCADCVRSAEVFVKAVDELVQKAMPDEYPEDAVVVCVPAAVANAFMDNSKGQCFKCGCDVVYRPYVPAEVKKVCIDCLDALVQAPEQ